MHKAITLVLLGFAVCSYALPPRWPAGDQDYSLEIDGKVRHYRVHFPIHIPDNVKFPIVLDLHGDGSDYTAAEEVTQLNWLSDREGFLHVSPDGTGGTWNAGRCCGLASKDKVDDVKFISTILGQLTAQFPIDRHKIYATGISNGGMMAYRLACQLSDQIAAVAAVAAVGVFPSCVLSQPVSVIHFHGTADACVPLKGGPGGACIAHYAKSESVANFLDGWRIKDHLPASKTCTLDKGKAHCDSFGPGPDHQEVTFCSLEGGGHTWPGGNYGGACKNPKAAECKQLEKNLGPVNQDISASELIWQFFKAHPKT